jgi:pilus assembly protein CpaB
MPRRMLLIGLTLLMAVVGTAGLLFYVRQADARAVAGKQTVSVLIAAKKVPAGTTVVDARRSGLLHSETMPKATVPDDTLLDVEVDLTTLADQVAAGDIAEGQLIRRPMFVAKAARVSGLVVPDGKLVMTIAVGAAEQVAGYLRAGSMVTVFSTFTVQEGQGLTPAGDNLDRRHEYDHATRVLLPKVQVLAIGPAQAEEKKSSATPSTDPNAAVLVTVAVTQAEAEKLVHGAQLGHLYLALVPDGVTPTASAGVDSRTVFNAARGE